MLPPLGRSIRCFRSDMALHLFQTGRQERMLADRQTSDGLGGESSVMQFGLDRCFMAMKSDLMSHAMGR